MLRECIISSVLSHHSKNLKWQTSVTAWLQLGFIWQAKENTSSRCEGSWTENKRGVNFWLLFLYFFFPLLFLSLPYVNWVSQEGCLFHLRYSLVLGPSFVPFLCASPFLVFQPPPFRTPFTYSNYLPFPLQEMGDPIHWEQGCQSLSGYFLLGLDSKGHWAFLLANLKPQSPYNSVHLRVSDIFHGQV